MTHKIEIQSTMGWKQARCECGWWASRSHSTVAPAKADGQRHLDETKEES